MPLRTLVVADTPDLYRRLVHLTSGPDVTILAAASASLWESLARDSFDLLLLSRAVLPEPAADVVSTLRKLPDRPEIVVLEDGENPGERADLLAAGCLGIVPSHLSDPLLAEALAALIARCCRGRLCRLRTDRGHPQRLSDFDSASAVMRTTLDLARRVAAADSSLLLLGETGVGKEWLAKAIHRESFRAAAPFIAINCAAIPDSLLESELFGHEKGAFTGAVRSRRGSLELAQGGTVLLDEIGDMSPHLQAKLLRFLEERSILRVGSERPVELDVRIMAATNRNLEEAISAKEFRKDLYFRLATISLLVPPLRERREDVPSLVATYLAYFQPKLGQPAWSIAPAALAALVEYSWPGNVRELIHTIERAVILCRSAEICLGDLPACVAGGNPAAAADRGSAALPAPPSDWLERPLRTVRREAIRQLEHAYLDGQLQQCSGRIGATAQRAGLAPRSLFEKMRELGLRKEDYRQTAAEHPADSENDDRVLRFG